MYKHALVPLDGSNLAECALNHVKNMIKDGCVREVTLVNIVKVAIPMIKIDDEFQHIDMSKVKQMAFQSSQQYIAGMAAQLALAGIQVNTESLEAERPDRAILDYAREKGMDIIVIATHGYGGMKRMLLGSVAFGVLNQSHVPVLLLRPEACQV